MSNIENLVKAIVIPSGNLKQDIERARKAIEFNREKRLNAPYILSGMGPDMIVALSENNPDKRELNFHRELYDYMIKNTEGVMGIDTLSLNSIQNILNTFPPEISGRYAIVSYPLHLRRFKRIVKEAKRKGKVSRDLELEYVPTQRFSSPGQIIYEAGSSMKSFLKRLIIL